MRDTPIKKEKCNRALPDLRGTRLRDKGGNMKIGDLHSFQILILIVGFSITACKPSNIVDSNAASTETFMQKDQSNKQTIQLSGSWDNQCIISENSVAFCRGLNNFGQLGNGLAGNTSSSFSQVMPPSGIRLKKIATGDEHSCALDEVGDVYCWGRNNYKQLGVASNVTAWSSTPLKILQPEGLKFTEITAGGNHTCGLTSLHKVNCWGMGYSVNDTQILKEILLPNGLDAFSISSGYAHTCSMASNGQAYCWGYNGYGQLGIGVFPSSYRDPSLVIAPAGVTFKKILAASMYSCAVSNQNLLYCFGEGHVGQLGNGSTQSSWFPSLVSLPSGATIDQFFLSDASTTCAITHAGETYCWGFASNGALGIGPNNASYWAIPQRVLMPTQYSLSQIGMGYQSAIGISKEGTPFCWGRYCGETDPTFTPMQYELPQSL